MSYSASRLIRADRVLVIAHRGDSREAPENTLAAFESALRLGADLVELDYVHSADGVPVVFHDRELDRVTDSFTRWGVRKIPVGSKTRAELDELDAGSWFAPQFAGTRIPTLDEALGTIHRGGALPMIERKAGDARTCVQLLSRRGLLEQVVLAALDWQYLAECSLLVPQLITEALGTEELSAGQLDLAQAIGAKVIGWDDRYVTKAHIEAVHRRGLAAWVWTVDDPVRAMELAGYGLDGLITNVPGQMLKLVGRSKRP